MFASWPLLLYAQDLLGRLSMPHPRRGGASISGCDAQSEVAGPSRDEVTFHEQVSGTLSDSRHYAVISAPRFDSREHGTFAPPDRSHANPMRRCRNGITAPRRSGAILLH